MDVYYLYNKERHINFGKIDLDESAILNLVENNKNLLKIKYEKFKDFYIVAFCTPKMLCALTKKEISSNIICIDSSGGMDRTQGHLFNLVIPGPAGSLSLGMFVTFSETQVCIEKGLNLLKSIWVENNAVGNDFGPKYFMSDDCNAQISAIKSVFNNCRVFLCQFHILNAMWKWLQQNVLANKRQEIMQDFRRVVYATNNWQILKTEFFQKNINENKISKHLEAVFKKQNAFCRYFRNKYPLHGVNTNNLVERSFLTIKSEFLERYKVYNGIQLIQRIASQYEITTSIKLADFFNGRSKYVYKLFDTSLFPTEDYLTTISKDIYESNFNNFNIDSLNREEDTSIIPNNDFSDDNILTNEEISNFYHQHLNEIPESKKSKLDLNQKNKALSKLEELENHPEFHDILNRFFKRLGNYTNHNQALNVLATGGVKNRNILKVQSRIGKNSSKIDLRI